MSTVLDGRTVERILFLTTERVPMEATQVGNNEGSVVAMRYLHRRL